jgi:AbrB family looped-hinge helix DNA binding protein
MKTMNTMNEVVRMELAKITSKGQITLPIAIRRTLKLNDGDKVAFVEREGQYLIVNPTIMAFERAQKAFEGEAERLGLNDISDVVALVKEVRAERKVK